MPINGQTLPVIGLRYNSLRRSIFHSQKFEKPQSWKFQGGEWSSNDGSQRRWKTGYVMAAVRKLQSSFECSAVFRASLLTSSRSLRHLLYKSYKRSQSQNSPSETLKFLPFCNFVDLHFLCWVWPDKQWAAPWDALLSLATRWPDMISRAKPFCIGDIQCSHAEEVWWSLSHGASSHQKSAGRTWSPLHWVGVHLVLLHSFTVQRFWREGKDVLTMKRGN